MSNQTGKPMAQASATTHLQRAPLATIAILFAVASVVAVVSPRSVLPFTAYAGLAYILGWPLGPKNRRWILPLYCVYSTVIVLVYLVHLATRPEHFGFAAGLDDAYFFSQVAEKLAPGFPTRVEYQARIHPFSSVLRMVSPWPVIHPLDILFFNAVGLSLLAPYTSATARQIFQDMKVERLAFKISLVSPMVLSTGLVLLRDSWIAVLTIAAVYFLTSRYYYLVPIPLALTFFLRIGSGAILTACILLVGLHILARNDWYSNRRPKSISLVLILAIMFVIATPVAIQEIQQRGLDESGGLRVGFFDYVEERGSFLSVILALPGILRVPLSFGFFLIAPIFNPSGIVQDTIFSPRGLLESVVYPILFTVYSAFAIRGIARGFHQRDRTIMALTAAYVLGILIISMASLQERHKTQIEPILYLLVAYGFYNRHGVAAWLGWVFSGLLVATYIVNLAIL